jgi:hypothetical protein
MNEKQDQAEQVLDSAYESLFYLATSYEPRVQADIS